MLNSQEEVLCFYIQDIVNQCRNLKNRMLEYVSSELSYNESYETFKYDIIDVLDFVSSLPTVYKTRRFIVTGATNDQVFISDWKFLKETFEDYMFNITKYLKIYYENIGKFYSKGKLNESIVINVNHKDYTYKDLENLFNLSLNYLFDVSPLVYYDKFKDTIR
jgi:hypothetical protein